MGIRGYGKNEITLILKGEFLKEKLNWKGKFIQVRRVGKICEERHKPTKVIMESVKYKHHF